jgi:hypothetical protein
MLISSGVAEVSSSQRHRGVKRTVPSIPNHDARSSPFSESVRASRLSHPSSRDALSSGAQGHGAPGAGLAITHPVWPPCEALFRSVGRVWERCIRGESFGPAGQFIWGSSEASPSAATRLLPTNAWL